MLPFRFFERLADPFGFDETHTPPATLWAFLRDQLAPFRGLIAIAFAVSMLVAFVEIGLIYYAGRIVDLLERTDAASFWSAHWAELLGVAIFLLLLRPAALSLHFLMLNQALSTNTMERVRWRAHKHLLGQSVGFFQNDFAGRIANRVMQTGPAVEDSLFMSLEAVVYSASYVVGAFLLLMEADWRLSVPLALWLAGYLLLLRRLIPRIGAASEKFSEARSAMTGRIVDSYANIQTVKLFAHGAREEAYALGAMKRSRLRFARLLRLITTLTSALAVLNGLLIVLVVGAALWLWSLGETSMGVVASATALTLRLNGMTGWIMWVTSQLFQLAGQIREGMQTISVPHDVTDAPKAPALAVAGGEIRFDGVHHHYGKGAGGLNGIELTIRPGERVGLVGRSGAGKSSLVNLLLRFHDPEQGRVLIDGRDIAAVTQDSLRRSIGMVTQDTSLLHRSVRDNILYGRPDATEAQMIEAASRVAAHEFIPALEDPQGRTGYDAHVGERGVKLSGGQRQRIAMARVVLKDAPILVLDEATSALDSEVEAAIQESLQGLMQGKTVIAIAHRLSTIAALDRIVVLERGAIAEQGSHAELLERDGLYARFWARQSGGFLHEDEVAAQ